MKVKVIIEETIDKEFQIEVPDDGDVIKEAIRLYKKGDLVLEPGEITGRAIACEIDNYVKWEEF